MERTRATTERVRRWAKVRRRGVMGAISFFYLRREVVQYKKEEILYRGEWCEEEGVELTD